MTEPGDADPVRVLSIISTYNGVFALVVPPHLHCNPILSSNAPSSIASLQIPPDAFAKERASIHKVLRDDVPPLDLRVAVNERVLVDAREDDAEAVGIRETRVCALPAQDFWCGERARADVDLLDAPLLHRMHVCAALRAHECGERVLGLCVRRADVRVRCDRPPEVKQLHRVVPGDIHVQQAQVAVAQPEAVQVRERVEKLVVDVDLSFIVYGRAGSDDVEEGVSVDEFEDHADSLEASEEADDVAMPRDGGVYTQLGEELRRHVRRVGLHLAVDLE